jgi:hypothetical protein
MRSIPSASRTLRLLAPSQRVIPAQFTQVSADPYIHADLLAETQRFRGRVYLEDGAIQPWQLTPDGRHCLPIDDDSWHLLVLDDRGRVCGCVRYREYPTDTSFSMLSLAHSALAKSMEWGGRLKSAVESERNLSRRLDYPLSELGGWALDEGVRGTAEALRMALATFALTQALGGAIAFSSVTERHDSASILRRMGGRSLELHGTQLPAYYDPSYDCQMEILRFYSWAPNPRYVVWIDEIKSHLQATQVITKGVVGPEWVAAAAIRAKLASKDFRHTACAG